MRSDVRTAPKYLGTITAKIVAAIERTLATHHAPGSAVARAGLANQHRHRDAYRGVNIPEPCGSPRWSAATALRRVATLRQWNEKGACVRKGERPLDRASTKDHHRS
jgi:antirestriction protein ArdC